MRSVCGELSCEGENRGLVFRVSRVVRFSFFFGWAFQVWNALRRREVLHESRIVGQVSTFFSPKSAILCGCSHLQFFGAVEGACRSRKKQIFG